jgi:hypothetical protein
MTFLHRDEKPATNGADFSASAQRPLDGRAIIRQIDNSGRKKHPIVRRSWPQQFDRIFSSDRARRPILVCTFHQMISSCPVAVTIEQCADDAAIQDSIKSFVFFLWSPLSDDFAVLQETSNMQSVRVRGAATPAHVVWSVFFLKRLRFHFCETPGATRFRRLTQTPYSHPRPYLSWIRPQLRARVKRARPD